jgi:rhamnosyltransferase
VRPCIKSVVVTFNSDIPLFERCLASVANLCEIIVVDNGSSNIDEIRGLLRRFPNSRLIELGANYGLSVAANVGIESAKDAD